MSTPSSNAVPARNAPSSPATWAYSFPLAAMTIATLLMTLSVGGWFFESLSMILLAVLSLIVLALIARTLLGIARHEICVEEG